MLKKDKATGKAIPYMSLPYFSVAGHTFIIDLINDFLPDNGNGNNLAY